MIPSYIFFCLKQQKQQNFPSHYNRQSRQRMSRKRMQPQQKNKKIPTGLTQGEVTLLESLPSYELPIYENGWSIYLQLILFEALELFGAQNWEMAAKFMNCTFGAEEIRDHYYRIYGDHDVQDQYKLYQGERYKMFIEQADFDIYIAAQKREQATKRRQQKEKKQKNIILDQHQHPLTMQPQPQKQKNKIPPQFGYEKYKKTFSQPYNEQAQIMVINLDINRNDSQEIRRDKIDVLNQYNQFINQRAIVEREVIANGLMECKYHLSRNNFVIHIPSDLYQQDQEQSVQDSIGRPRGRSRQSSRKKGRASEQTRQEKKSEYVQKQLFFRINRHKDDEMSEQLSLIYTKIKKYDKMEQLKKLLVQYEQKCAQAINLKKNIQENI